MSNPVAHFELTFDDSDRAQRFYSEAFGWQMMPMPEMGYVMVGTGPTDEQGNPTQTGFVNGGMMQRQGDFTATNIVISVDDVETALKTVESSGGSVVQEKMAVGDMGFVGYFRDTEGNLVGLWQDA